MQNTEHEPVGRIVEKAGAEGTANEIVVLTAELELLLQTGVLNQDQQKVVDALKRDIRLKRGETDFSLYLAMLNAAIKSAQEYLNKETAYRNSR